LPEHFGGVVFTSGSGGLDVSPPTSGEREGFIMSDMKTAKTHRELLTAIKGTPEWKAWVLGLADFLRVPLPVLMDNALCNYARQVSFEPEPPKR
jgi:hypothetical protein